MYVCMYVGVCAYLFVLLADVCMFIRFEYVFVCMQVRAYKVGLYAMPVACIMIVKLVKRVTTTSMMIKR
jgi:hypothetical protein